MAVYRQKYRPYEGPLTPSGTRFLVLPRYVYQRFFESKLFLLFFLVCYLPPLVVGFLIYLRYNLRVLERLNIPNEALLPVDPNLFLGLMGVQGVLAYLMTVLLGPGLISPDLGNNALPLYFSRPFSRLEYVAGKMSVMLILLSLISWVPLAVLFFLQSVLAGSDWMDANSRILWATLAGSAIWMVFLSSLALAVSAWIRWKPVAAAALFGTFFLSLAFGNIINEIFETRYGDLFNLKELIGTVWLHLFLDPGAGEEGLPVWMAWTALAAGCCLFAFLLSRKIKPQEVVR